MKELLLIVPTRNRLNNVKDLIEQVAKNSVTTQLCFGIDDDDQTDYPDIPGVIYEVGPRTRIGGTINTIAMKYVKDYPYIAFLGDDHRPRTYAWDRTLIEPLITNPGFSYGNDLLQGENLATAVVMSSCIVNELGYIVPPTLKHFYFDNFWMDLGREIGSLHYFDHVIIEHMHPLIKKSEVDKTYDEAWSVLSEDEQKYIAYKENDFMQDVERVRTMLENLNYRS